MLRPQLPIINAFIALSALGLLDAPPSWAASYTITNLGALSGRNSSMVRSINSAGHVAGRSGTAVNGGTSAFLWTGGPLQALGPLPGGEFSEAAAVNDLDQVVGSSNTAINIRAFRWTRLTGMQDLGTLAGDAASQAFAINRSGSIAGYSTGENGTNAVVWDSFAIRKLDPLPGGRGSRATGINDSGLLVGFSATSSSRTHAVVWNRGTTAQDLGTLPGDSDSQASAANNGGQVVGSSRGPTGYRAVLWNPRSAIQSLGTLPGGEFSQALGINDSGAVVGLSTVASGETHAFLWTPSDGMRDLNDFIPANSNVLIVSAVGINSRGQIIAFGGDASTYHHDSPIKIYLLTRTQ